jgi:hypothetical protein
MMKTRTRQRLTARIAAALFLLAGSSLRAADGALDLPATIEFNRDVRPILSDTCFKCHGPDKNARKADLRLDLRGAALTKRDDGTIPIVPGKPMESEVYKRLVAADQDDLMPPPKAKLPLSARQIAVIKTWIEQGAEYQPHWSLVPVKQPVPPTLKNARPSGNAIDQFVRARLAAEGLRPSPRAAAQTLIRRVTLDLTGLPPTPEEVDAFLNDVKAESEAHPGTPESMLKPYERLVDRLLASPAFGERMAWDWLDAARYADSNGYQGDGERTMWPWRDWVVSAYNRNQRFDEFTVWQLAGDQLDAATDEQRLATGFNRNHMINGEGGRIAEENRIEYVFDQAETTATVWLGLTFNCCRCHDHKFDPLTKTDYFSLFAFFNQTPVTGGGGDPATPPAMEAMSAQQRTLIAGMESRIAMLNTDIAKRESALAGLLPQREQQVLASLEKQAWRVLAPTATKAEHQTLTTQEDQSILASGPNPKNDTYTVTFNLDLDQLGAIRLEALRHPTMTQGGIARSDSGNFVLTEIEAMLKPAGETESRPLKFSTAQATYEQGEHKIAGTFDGKRETGWAVWEGKPVDRDHQAVLRFAKPVAAGKGAVLTLVLRHDSPHVNHNLGRFRISATDTAEAKLDPARDTLIAALRTPADKRDKVQNELIAASVKIDDEKLTKLRGELEGTRKSIADIRKGLPRVMIMQDMPKPRKTFALDKGFYNKPMEEVSAATPAALPAMPEAAAKNRLGLARWLVAPENPLTARVTINRLWSQFFGIGLVKTAEDFGSQGEMPIHQDLLDWLAAEFVRRGWDVKAMCRLIVTSDTYMQVSKVSSDLYERDPYNRLLARGARFRMPSWMLRDQALAISGLLVNKVGGPPVKPYQPSGVWEEATFGNKKYTQDKGEALYRRSIYVFWRRIVGPTMFFDSAARQVCTVKQLRTNSPLHALTMLNDIAYVEAARAMAQRVMHQGGATNEQRITFAMRLALSRPPTAEEQSILLAALARVRKEFAADPDSAKKLLTTGESLRDEKLDAIDHASWTAICNAVLNLDEALTKE